MVHLKKIFKNELVKVEMESWNVQTYYMSNHRIRDLLFHSFRLLVFWLLVFKTFYDLIRASYPSHKICVKEGSNRKETMSLDHQNKILEGFKVHFCKIHV